MADKIARIVHPPTKREIAGETTALLNSTDEALAEGVDFSEGGWATDFAASLVGLLFFVSALLFYKSDGDDMHWAFMYIGTSIAHCFGGLAHRYFPNRAADGVGMKGFYWSMMLGYGGNCMRYGLGWFGMEGSKYIFLIALLNFLYLVGTGLYAIATMTHTTEVVDNAEGTGFAADTNFVIGEAFCALMEVATTIIVLVQSSAENTSKEAHALLVVACLANLTGWVAVYIPGFIYTIKPFNYDPSLMQRIFHLCMILMLWALDAHVRST